MAISPLVCTSIIGGIQPGPFEQYVCSAVSGGKGGDGFIQWFQLAVWPDLGVWQHVDRLADAQAKEKAFAVFENTAEIDPEAIDGEADADEAFPVTRFTQAAQKHVDKWYRENETRARKGLLPASVEPHFAVVEIRTSPCRPAYIPFRCRVLMRCRMLAPPKSPEPDCCQAVATIQPFGLLRDFL